MEEKEERIYIRISSREKEIFKKEADKNDQSLSQFIREACREKIKKEKNNGR